MKFSFTRMTEEDAREILGWKYEEPYDYYNSDPSELEADVQKLIDPQNIYFALRDEDGYLIGYYCFGSEARVEGGDYTENAVDIAGGVRPDMAGTGMGATFIQVGMDFAALIPPGGKFRITLASFNKRALNMCENADFRTVQTFRGPEGREFVILTKEAYGSQIIST